MGPVLVKLWHNLNCIISGNPYVPIKTATGKPSPINQSELGTDISATLTILRLVLQWRQGQGENPSYCITLKHSRPNNHMTTKELCSIDDLSDDLNPEQKTILQVNTWKEVPSIIFFFKKLRCKDFERKNDGK